MAIIQFAEAESSLDSHVVLLVDRDEDNRALYAQYLTLLGHCEVHQAEDGREALAKALSCRYDAIVTETQLPGIDGLELCRLLRGDQTTAHVPLVVLTADPLARDARRAVSAGAAAVLLKPCLPDALLNEVRQAIARSQRAVTSDNVQRTDPPRRDRAEGTSRRRTLSRAHRRGDTTAPALAPPELRCPSCDNALTYRHSHVGGVSARHPEQWDYFQCPANCGTFEYRQRTRKMRKVDEATIALAPR